MSVFTFVVPCHNNLALTKAFLRSFLVFTRLGPEIQLVFVDDASTDNTLEWLLHKKSPFIRIFSRETNGGFSKAMNLGISNSHSEYTILLNNDLEFTPGWFEPFREAARTWTEVCGLLGNIQRRVSDGLVEHAGVRFANDGRIVHIKVVGGATYSESALLTGACLMAKTSDLKRLNGFDERYRNGAEDFDLCMKFLAEGRINRVMNRSIIYHHVSATRGTNPVECANLALFYHNWSDQLSKMMHEQDVNSQEKEVGGTIQHYREIINSRRLFHSM